MDCLDALADWVQWLSWRFNSTETKLYSFAQWGATIDNRIEQRGGIPSLFDEVNHFEAHFTTLPWSGSNSVFGAFRSDLPRSLRRSPRSELVW